MRERRVVGGGWRCNAFSENNNRSFLYLSNFSNLPSPELKFDLRSSESRRSYSF